MAPISITIVEDEFMIAEDIKSLLLDHEYQLIDVFSKAEDALPSILGNPPDLLLVDIRLSGKMSGIELVKNVKLKFSIPVIYITANSDTDTYTKAKLTSPNAFLIKPFTHSNLLAAVDLALYNFAQNRTPDHISRSVDGEQPYSTYINKCLFIRVNGKHKKVCSENILFVEANGSYVSVQTDAERYVLSQNLNNFLIKTPLRQLVRIHRSYVINIDRVDSFDESSVLVLNHKLPISETYRAEFLSKIHCL